MTMAWINHYVLVATLILFLPLYVVLGATGDYYRSLIIGEQYSVSNARYPRRYANYTSIRWTYNSEPGTRIVLACPDIDLPSSTSCRADRLSISLSGKSNLEDAKPYCGRGTLSLISQDNRLVIGLYAPDTSPGGRFFCSLAVTLKDPAPTTLVTRSVCDCGWEQTTRIVGGVETRVSEFPSMAGIVDLTLNRVYCGGAIISNRYVLTAGHCLWSRDSSKLAVLVGDHDLSIGTDTPYARLYVVSAYEIHPNYNHQAQTNDIGLIQTAKVIDFNLYVGPVCLPFRFTANDFYGQYGTVLGWGQKEFSGPTSDVLLKAQVQVIPNKECAALGDENVLPNQLCTFTPGRDTCQGDSGGPLLWKDTSQNRFHVIGIVSSGVGCASSRPGINSRVTSFITWIVSRTSDANYCVK